MSAFGGKADITVCGCPLLRSLLGQSGHWLLRRICLLLTQSGHWLLRRIGLLLPQGGHRFFYYPAPPKPLRCLGLGGSGNETTRIHHINRWRYSMAAGGAGTTTGNTRSRLSGRRPTSRFPNAHGSDARGITGIWLP